MTKKRDSIEEILSKKHRHLKKANRVTQFFRRFHPLQDGLTHTLKNVAPGKKFRPELLKYFPIGAVACLEGYFRTVLKDLIDSGSPYRENAEGFKENFNLRIILALQDRKISIGEFIAHILPLSNLTHIDNNMSTLLGDKFLSKLRITPYDDFKDQSLRDITLGNNAHVLYRDVERLFVLRHIYCHELAPLERVSVKEIIKCFNAALEFFYVTEFLVMDLLNGPAFFR